MNDKSILSQLITDYVVVDIETTGLSPFYDKIIEIAAVKVINGAVTDTFSTFVDPHCIISHGITMLTGITNEMVKGAPEAAEAVKSLSDFVGEYPILGHNIKRFDLKFLQKYEKLDNHCVDTLGLAEKILCDEGGNSLSALCSRYKIVNDNAHRALSDCIATHEVYMKLKDSLFNSGAHISMSVSCSKKEYQTGIREQCSVGMPLRWEFTEDSILLYIQNHAVGTVSGGKFASLRDNREFISSVIIESITQGAKDKLHLRVKAYLNVST